MPEVRALGAPLVAPFHEPLRTRANSSLVPHTSDPESAPHTVCPRPEGAPVDDKVARFATTVEDPERLAFLEVAIESRGYSKIACSSPRDVGNPCCKFETSIIRASGRSFTVPTNGLSCHARRAVEMVDE